MHTPRDITGETGHETDRKPAITDAVFIQDAVVEFFGEGSRYPDHNARMTEALDSQGLSTPGLEVGVELHDFVDHGLINPKDDETKANAQQGLQNLYEKVEDKDQLLYGVASGISGAGWEREIERWRPSGPDAFSHNTIEERTYITAAIDHVRMSDMDESILKAASLDGIEVDTSSLLENYRRFGPQGLVLKGVEVPDNINNPPPDPAPVFRDGVEGDKFWAPALGLFGFKPTANELRGSILLWRYDQDPDIVKKAKTQRELSERFFHDIEDRFKNEVKYVLTETGETIGQEALSAGTEIKSRIKHEGSIREKLSTKRYSESYFVPDGIGFRLVIPDEMLIPQELEGEDLRDEEKIEIIKNIVIEIGDKLKALLTEAGLHEVSDQDKLEHVFFAEHPIDSDPIEESIREARESGYSSYHLALQFLEDEDSDSVVPWEIQIVTASQEREHHYSRASEVLRKARKKPTLKDLEDLRLAEVVSEHAPDMLEGEELSPHLLFDLLEYLPPKMDTPLQRTYKLVKTPKARFMVPHELEKLAEAMLQDEELEGDIILPPATLSTEDFYSLIGLLNPALKENKQIQEAIQLLQSRDLPTRRDGTTPQLEGHLLPVAYHGAVLSALSLEYLEEKGRTQHLVKTIICELLHDIVEETKGEEAKKSIEAHIRDRFGDEITDEVMILTAPDIEDPDARRKSYSEKIGANPRVLRKKLSDRTHNILTDIVSLATTESTVEGLNRKKRYVRKTNQYFSNLFSGEKVPQEYSQLYKTVMKLAEPLSEIE